VRGTVVEDGAGNASRHRLATIAEYSRADGDQLGFVTWPRN
jgi:hypothetical protein